MPGEQKILQSYNGPTVEGLLYQRPACCGGLPRKTPNPTFPRNLPVCGSHTPRTTVEGTELPSQPSGDLICKISCVWKAIRPYIPPFRRTSCAVFTLPSVPSAYAGAGLGRRSSISIKIFRNKSLGTATSASWKVT